jgi:oxygen-independent coproporphyrinogen-3 oxidase
VPRTIFLGGGTPTHIDTGRLEGFLDGLRAILGDAELIEFTVEANPGTLDLAKVQALRRAGVNRVSLGVQSFDDRQLRTLGRIHDAAEAVRAAEIVREGGIEHFSVDLILALPGQTLAAQDRDLSRAVELAPRHVSAYVLTYEEGTPFERLLRTGRLPPVDEDRELAHLRLAVERLREAGYDRYEISNFARPGSACRHNLAYWRNADWCGLGAGAHSHSGRSRWKNVDDPAQYVQRIREGKDAVAWRETAPPEVALFEALMMGLRLVEGVDLEELATRWGVDLRRTHGDVLSDHRNAGLLESDDTRIRLTERGQEVLSSVLVRYMPDTEPVREAPATE